MSSISFTAHGRCARATVCEPITTGSVGLSVSFAFDAAWSGLQKTAIFRGSGMAVDLVLSGDAATVPPEVLTIPGGDLRVGVWGADPDGNVIIPTVWATVGEIVPGAAPSGIDPQPPAPSWAAQVQEIAQDALDTANSVREDADAGAFDGATYTPAVSAGGDLSWTNDKGKPNPPTVNIKGPEGQPGQTGATPDISIGTVETLPPGSPATATMTGTAENPVLSFGIPQGQQGAPGEVTQAEFDALADEVTQQKSAIDDLSALVDRKAGMLVDTASGAIASFLPDATIDNLLGVTVDIEPVQDLHGYDSPWPAGGGANKWDEQWEVGDIEASTGQKVDSAYTIRSKNFIGVTPETTYYKYIPSGYALCLYYYDANYAFLQRDSDGNSGARPFTTPQNCKYILFSTYNTYGTTYKNDIAINYPSTVTTYSPYSNECPISGWDSVEVERTGVNLWDEQWESGDYIDADGQPHSQGTRIRTINPIHCKPSTTYYFSLDGKHGQLFYYDRDDNFISTTSWINDGQTFTTPSSCRLIRFYLVATTEYTEGVGINYPATDHTYRPYAGNRYTITIGQTVYGGTLTIAEDGSVNALIDRVADKISDLTCSKSEGGYQTFVVTPTHGMASGESIALVQSSAWKGLPQDQITSSGDNYVWGSSANGTIRIKTTTYASLTASEFKEMFADAQLCYLLATPITITLDPVTISTISGQTNTVWADAGNVSVEFAADLKHYIDSKIAAAVAALS